jgi:hypothetical protein
MTGALARRGVEGSGCDPLPFFFVPQRLKPLLRWRFFGTAEAVP